MRKRPWKEGGFRRVPERTLAFALALALATARGYPRSRWSSGLAHCAGPLIGPTDLPEAIRVKRVCR